MSRLKLFLLILIIAALGIVFVQNREPIALKVLCPDSTQACVYQTPSLPLAVWIGLFTLGGTIASLLGQTLNRYRYGGTTKQKYSTEDGTDNSQSWSKKSDVTTSKIRDRDTSIYSPGYEKPQEPQSVEKSGSTYSYKYKDKKGSNNSSPKISRESEINLNKDEDEDWI